MKHSCRRRNVITITPERTHIVPKQTNNDDHHSNLWIVRSGVDQRVCVCVCESKHEGLKCIIPFLKSVRINSVFYRHFSLTLAHTHTHIHTNNRCAHPVLQSCLKLFKSIVFCERIVLLLDSVETSSVAKIVSTAAVATAAAVASRLARVISSLVSIVRSHSLFCTLFKIYIFYAYQVFENTFTRKVLRLYFVLFRWLC